ncbi:MAG: hypothetical protein IJS60_06025 [Abditibacteriota bacterium]|nr:hypothetical protein [Abditibacteriota bacterium]
MKKYCIILCLILLTSILNADKAALIYSSFTDYQGKNIYDKTLKEANIDIDYYENIEIDKLCANINNYDIVIGSIIYNYSNTVDFSLYGKAFYDYVYNGGALILTDMHYTQLTDWVPKVFGLDYMAGDHKPDLDRTNTIFTSPHHPLIRDVVFIHETWGESIKVSPEYSILSVNVNGKPDIVYKEIGKGLLFVSNLCAMQSFPTPEIFNNILAYVRSKKERKPIIAESINISSKPTKKKKLNYIPPLEGAKGKVKNHEEEEATRCEWQVHKDEKGIYFSFECYDNDLINTVNTEEAVFNDDCIEIYLKPNLTIGTGDTYYFVFNQNNNIYDAKNYFPNYDTYIESNAKVLSQKNKWTLDIFIPYSSIGINKDVNLDEKSPFYFNIVRVYHPFKDNEGLYSHSPNQIMADTNTWGTLNFDTPIKTKLFKITTPITLTVPEDVSVGENIFKTNIKTNIQIKDLTTGDIYQGKLGECKVNIKKPGEHIFIASAIDKNMILATSPSVKINATDVFNIKVVYPLYRDIVQSKDPDKTMEIHLTTIYQNPKAYYIVELKNDNKTIITKTEKATPDIPFVFTYDLSNLPVGDYNYTITLKEGEKSIKTLTKTFKILPPASFEVTFDKKKICYINGEPFFPIGLYHLAYTEIKWLNDSKKEGVPELNLDEVNKQAAERGFNLVTTLNWYDSYPYSKERADSALKQGMIYNLELGKVSDSEEIKKMVETFNQWNTGLFYYTVDEPIDESLDMAIDIYEKLKVMDPHRPCCASVAYPGVFYGANKAFDIMMPDTYLFRNSHPSIAGLLDPINVAKDACNNEKPIWATLQAFGWIEGGMSVPTLEELRAQQYFYLTQGVTGLFWYGLTSPEKDPVANYGLWYMGDDPMWDYFKILNSEIKRVSNILFKGNNIGPLEGDNDKIYSNVWEVDNNKYAIIVNPEREPLSVTYDIKGEITPFFEEYKYNITQSEGKTTFNLNELECVIIKY